MWNSSGGRCLWTRANSRPRWRKQLASAQHPGAQSVPRPPHSVGCSGSLFTPEDNSLKKMLLEEVAFLLNYSLDWL